jgi:prepilin-type N-terminal cleavage/methylation domain-containing protein
VIVCHWDAPGFGSAKPDPHSVYFWDGFDAGMVNADFPLNQMVYQIMRVKNSYVLGLLGAPVELSTRHCNSQFLSTWRFRRGFTLTEVVVAMAVAVLVFAGVIMGLTQATYRGEWAAYNLAAQNLAQQGVEQARASSWDPQAPVPVDNCNQTNFPATTNNVLDVIIRTTNNIVYATNTWTITNIYSNNSTYPLKMIRVDCTWPWLHNGIASVFTNSVVTYRAPAQ